MFELIYLGFGSNLGDRGQNIAHALRLLPPLVAVEAVSRIYETEPVGGPPGQPNYLNAACRARTVLTPRDLLRHVKRIEALIGREPGERWAPRVIDIDILLYGERRVDQPDLVIPHPRMWEREFVLKPLRDLDESLVRSASAE